MIRKIAYYDDVISPIQSTNSVLFMELLRLILKSIREKKSQANFEEESWELVLPMFIINIS